MGLSMISKDVILSVVFILVLSCQQKQQETKYDAKILYRIGEVLIN